jgi:glutamate-1-semialdehyde 2,1-aminomutase
MHTPDPNADLVARANRVIPGGVNSQQRRLAWPLAIAHAHGATFTDVAGTTYLDYHAAFGPLILGHNHPQVNAAVRDVLDHVDITGVGVTELEVRLAETLNHYVPSAERVLLCSSGTEATYAAIRLARAATGRTRIVKFQGTYHGWHDAVALNMLSTPERIGTPDPLSRGIMPEVLAQTLVLPFNDVDALTQLMTTAGETIAAILVEIVPHNMGCVLPQPAFLAALRQLTSAYGSVLIFDEVITGIRHDLGGYQRICGVTPDLSTFAKAMANGFPIAALVGRAALMDQVAPGGGVMFAGTYNGHPVGTAAALATLALLADGSIHQHCFALAERVASGLQAIADEYGIPLTVARYGSIFVPYFLTGTITNYTDLLRNNTAHDLWFRQAMCRAGIFMLPSALKRSHISAAHTTADIDHTLEIARDVLRALSALRTTSTEC